MNNKTILIAAIVFVLIIGLIYWQYTKKQLEIKERELALAASPPSTAPSTDTKLSTALASGTALINTFQSIFGGLSGGSSTGTTGTTEPVYVNPNEGNEVVFYA